MTRKQRAAELLRLIKAGPSLVGFVGDHARAAGVSPTAFRAAMRDAEASTRLWLDTWVLPQVRALVPETRSDDERA